MDSCKKQLSSLYYKNMRKMAYESHERLLSKINKVLSPEELEILEKLQNIIHTKCIDVINRKNVKENIIIPKSVGVLDMKKFNKKFEEEYVKMCLRTKKNFKISKKNKTVSKK